MDMEVDAQFFAKEDGIIAGIALAEMIFYQDDHSLKPKWSKKDGDTVHNELQFWKVSGKAHKIVVAERVVLNVMQANEWNSNVKEALHASGAYTQLVNEENVEKLECLQICNKSKVSVNIEKVKPYYLSLLEKEEAN